MSKIEDAEAADIPTRSAAYTNEELRAAPTGELIRILINETCARFVARVNRPQYVAKVSAELEVRLACTRGGS